MSVPAEQNTPVIKEILFGRANQKIFRDGLWDNNPITYQVMGICSALAVTTNVSTALVMSLGLIFVQGFSEAIISALRNHIPPRIRIIVQMAVVSTFVITLDLVLKAYFYPIWKQLTVFIGLIITNTLVVARLEGFAMHNPPWKSFLDGTGNAMGYGLALIVVSSLREILGSGTLLGFHVIPGSFYEQGYSNNGLMLLSPGAFFVLGLLIWGHRTIAKYVEGK
ncbi:MAG: NADH:ubiquinone reductase (Na(+)-transporting) subunit D [Candidatus Omnitrophica bacterium]|nr:NADH:ubiquinone reductase (Na(+)-transporting) subunit D [Candidatus Omnitrophota bacterium]